MSGPTILAVSPGLDAQRVEAVVCVPTFRRPDHLRLTLASLGDQAGAPPFAVVVAENDAEGREGAAAAGEALARGPLAGLVVLAPVQGNCGAINAAFEAALRHFPNARHLLMIDDDEVASATWLEAMIATAERFGADIVGGPVHAQVPPGARPALAQHPAFRPAHDRTGPVPLIYGSGNCLIGREVFSRLPAPPFDLAFNHLGGGDTDFFVRARDAGARFAWCAEAQAYETIPPERVTWRWLARRGLRIGAVNYRIERRRAAGPAGRARLLAKSLALVALAPVRATQALRRSGEPLAALHPLLVALGRLGAALGAEHHQYRSGRA